MNDCLTETWIAHNVMCNPKLINENGIRERLTSSMGDKVQDMRGERSSVSSGMERPRGNQRKLDSTLGNGHRRLGDNSRNGHRGVLDWRC
jgi:hypothetical protein